MINILAIDDDVITLELIKKILNNDTHKVYPTTNVQEAEQILYNNPIDVVLSDLNLPVGSGDDFLKVVRTHDVYIPFIILTSLSDMDRMVKLMKNGADDYIQKPLDPDLLLMRLEKVFIAKQNQQLLDKARMDEKVDTLLEANIVHWKKMYGGKDTEQTNEILSFLTRNIDQGGGFMWLDYFQDLMNESDSDEITLDKGMGQVIVESASVIQKILADLTFIASIQVETIPLECFSVQDFLHQHWHYSKEELTDLAVKYKRELAIQFPRVDIPGFLRIHSSYLKDILWELLINAIKYSPEESRILLFVNPLELKGRQHLEIAIWNDQKGVITAKEDDQRDVFGIPYEFSESVFNLFYTMEAFPSILPEEKWSQGTGLYISRQILRNMHIPIEAFNTVMYTLEEPKPFVKVSITIPLYNEEA